MITIVAAWLTLASPALLPAQPPQNPAAVAKAEVSTVPALEECAGCHDEQSKAFAAGPHGRAMARDAKALERSCATCHEGSQAHVQNPSKANIRRLPRDSACASCHATESRSLLLGMPAHKRSGVACVDCHAAGHLAASGSRQVRTSTSEACMSCHKTERAKFELPFAHRDREAPMSCTACHSAHGMRRTARLSLLDRNGACLECHTELAGPFVFPHAPREAGGCLSCHEPHGSTNPRMLTRHSVAELCMECHTNVPHDIVSARYRRCTGCHSAIHGSNGDKRLFDR
ncbi:MAG TPA: cytochrome c3 family protein [Thermoanaerobaculia bacterium]|nr:cytochrome c3 family protein [Thermoanaerobaculia bacterium]